MLLCVLVFSIVFLPGGARRSLRILDSHNDAQQQDNALTKGVEGSVGVREAWLPAIITIPGRFDHRLVYGQQRATVPPHESEVAVDLGPVARHATLMQGAGAARSPEVTMGRGDKRTKKGKRFAHSFGNSRPRNAKLRIRREGPGPDLGAQAAAAEQAAAERAAAEQAAAEQAAAAEKAAEEKAAAEQAAAEKAAAEQAAAEQAAAEKAAAEKAAEEKAAAEQAAAEKAAAEQAAADEAAAEEAAAEQGAAEAKVAAEEEAAAEDSSAEEAVAE